MRGDVNNNWKTLRYHRWDALFFLESWAGRFAALSTYVDELINNITISYMDARA